MQILHAYTIYNTFCREMDFVDYLHLFLFQFQSPNVLRPSGPAFAALVQVVLVFAVLLVVVIIVRIHREPRADRLYENNLRISILYITVDAVSESFLIYLILIFMYFFFLCTKFSTRKKLLGQSRHEFRNCNSYRIW